MVNTNLFAPAFVDAQRRRVVVFTRTVSARNPWRDYNKYEYLFGVGPRLQHIPRHTWGSEKSALAHLERAERLICFMDDARCTPMAVLDCPESHRGIELLDHTDHQTWWVGPQGEPLVLIEPYTLRGELLDEIATRRLTAWVMPGSGIYAGGGGRSISVFLCAPQQAHCLERLSTFWFGKSAQQVQQLTWFEALNLGKGHTL